MKRTSWWQGLSVTADDAGVVPLAGSVAVRLLADRVGLTDGLSAALARRGFSPGHDRGQVWVDVAVMLTAGDEVCDREHLPGPSATNRDRPDEAVPAPIRDHQWSRLTRCALRRQMS